MRPPIIDQTLQIQVIMCDESEVWLRYYFRLRVCFLTNMQPWDETLDTLAASVSPAPHPLSFVNTIRDPPSSGWNKVKVKLYWATLFLTPYNINHAWLQPGHFTMVSRETKLSK